MSMRKDREACSSSSLGRDGDLLEKVVYDHSSRKRSFSQDLQNLVDDDIIVLSSDEDEDDEAADAKRRPTAVLPR